ncbi:PP2C family serine/threonine-protein phosphatase [Actinocatenispora comari]|uniref:PPM-type phosphatase domain-containing protein n=1 Tax=Actinocatenispora comari TaxID=2807577 RepID=A0A8J4AA90_9ACTN|nr:protein phosphatase 2C domain-containing protein [Actinocatenispora comari]GIL27616.1 hypothetical protein NUM_28700 [Actinocatenispora comari]
MVIAQTIDCPACGAPASAGFRFCEACGTPLHGVPAPSAAAEWVSSSTAPQRCEACGHTGFSSDGYCDQCGQRGPTGPDHSEFDLGPVAGVSDIGHRHERNEDAFALGTLPGTPLVVVCDGVSSSSRGDAASHAAVDAALPVLRTALTEGSHPERAIARSVHAAREAVTAVAGPDQGNPPSCTFVAAVVSAGSITVGWVGDSRAYWLPDGGTPCCVTVDDSLANELIASGMPADEAHAQPHSGALVRWIGVDADDGPPKARTFTPEGPGRLIVCSDGLSRYRSAPEALASSTPPGPPLAVARQLTQLALDAGGVDNITVVVVPYPPAAPTEGSAQ